MAENKRYIAFTVPGKPVGKQRPRFSRRGTAVRTYTPRQTAEYERLVKESYIAAGGEKLEGWQQSQGARMEKKLAEEMGIDVLELGASGEIKGQCI